MTDLAGIVATTVAGVAVGVLVPYLRQATVCYWSPHSFLFQNVTDANLSLRTDALTVQNTGRKMAENVEVVLTNQPDHFQVSPPLDYEEDTTADGKFVIRLPTLGPKEFTTIQALSYVQPFTLLNVRSSAGAAEQIDFQIQRVFPTWVRALLALFLWVGFGFTAYWLIRAVAFLSGEMGIG